MARALIYLATAIVEMDPFSLRDIPRRQRDGNSIFDNWSTAGYRMQCYFMPQRNWFDSMDHSVLDCVTENEWTGIYMVE
jgi:hypothetical protein